MSPQPVDPTPPAKSKLSWIFASIRDSRSKLQRQRPKSITDFVHPSPPPLTRSLPPPEDITSRLADEYGLEYKLARKVSQAYVDKAVELQFLSKKRLTTNHKKAIRAVRSSNAVSSLENFQSRLCNSHRSFYKRDLRSLLKQTVQLAQTSFPTPVVPESEDTEDEDPTSPSSKAIGDSADGSDDEDDGDGEGGAVNAEDEKALQDMGARASVLLSRMYELGFTFPKRHEKIKLAEATGLTYRQISIWYSNRRERNQPGRRNGLSAASYRDAVSATRESTVDFTSGRETTECTSPTSPFQEGSSSCPITLDEEAMSPARTELDGPQDEGDDLFGTDSESDDDHIPAGQDTNMDGSRIPSLTASVSTLESVLPGGGDLQFQDISAAPWPYSDPNAFVDLGSNIPNMATFDFNSAMNMPADVVLPATAASSIAFWDTSFLPNNALPPVAAPEPSAEFLAGFAAGAAYNNKAPQYNTEPMMNVDPSGWSSMGMSMAPMPSFAVSNPNDPAGIYSSNMADSLPSTSYGSMPPQQPQQQQETYEVEEPRSRPLKRARVTPSQLAAAMNSSAAPRSKTSSGKTHRRMATGSSSSLSAASASRSASTTNNNASTTLLHKTPSVGHIAIAPRPAPVPSANGMRTIKPMPNGTSSRRSSVAVNPMLISTPGTTAARQMKPAPPSSQRRMAIAPAPAHPGLSLPILQQ